jgi:YVTN family beta-propeller protein
MMEIKKMETQARQQNKVKTSSLFVLGFIAIAVLLASVTLGQDYAYVTNAGDMGDGINGDVSVIDLATNTVIATVPVGGYPQGVAVNPAGTAVYVANSDTNDITVIDTATYKTTTIPGGASPVGAAMHPDGTRVYVANCNDTVNTVSVIDRATNTVIDRLFCGNGSIALAAHPDGSVIYVANIFEGAVAILSTETHKVIDKIMLKPVGADELCFPVPIVVHPDGTYIYVANRLGPTLWAINTATHEYIARSFGHSHCGLAINPAGTVLYLPDFNAMPMPPTGTTLDVVDARTLDRITTIDGLTGPLDVSVHPDGTRVYITNWGANTVSVVDAATNALTATITVGSHPHGFGEFMGPGVPLLLKQNAVARVEAAKNAIAAGAEGVNSPQKAVECFGSALMAGNTLIQPGLWAATGDGKVDPRRVHRVQGGAVFLSEQTMVKATLDAIRLGWIVNTKLQADLLAVVDETVRADRVLAAVVIDDAILAKADAAGIDRAQEMLKQADALAKEAAVWPQFDKKASVFCDAIDQYRNAWKAALDLVP